MKEKFKDYSEEAINQKLKQIEEFEAKHGENQITRSWRSWCENETKRRKEWEWRQALSETLI